MLLALVSPIDRLGDTYLFSVHMLQHLILLVIVPPLLLLGLPPKLLERALQWKMANQVERVLGVPLLAWIVGEITLWGWHIPALYNAALAHQGIHIVQHLSFLVTSTILWWPVIGSVASRRRMNSLAGGMYLVATGLSSSVLGIILTFAHPGLYPIYEHPPGSPAILALIRHSWGISVAADQQLGGLLMWVASTPIYLLAIAAIMVRWYREPEDDAERAISVAEIPSPALQDGRDGMSVV